MSTAVPRITDPQAIPVAGVDDHLPPVPVDRLHAQALRQRFAAPPAWQPEIPGDGAIEREDTQAGLIGAQLKLI